MKAAFIIYNGMTALDFVGVYDPLIRLHTMNFRPDFNWEICSFKMKKIKSYSGLEFTATKCGVDLNSFDLIIIPGGKWTRKLINRDEFLDWLAEANKCELVASVCTGSLLLGAAGLLRNKKATTHLGAMSLLEKYCQEVVKERIVDEGSVITAGGVTAAVELGLYLCEKIAGKKVKNKIAKQMEYRG